MGMKSRLPSRSLFASRRAMTQMSTALDLMKCLVAHSALAENDRRVLYRAGVVKIEENGLKCIVEPVTIVKQ